MKSLKKKFYLIIIFSLLLFLPILFQSLNFSGLPSYFFKIISFGILLLIPGYYLAINLGRELKLSFEEILILDLVLSMALTTFTCIYLSFLFNQITIFILTSGLLLIVLISGLIDLYIQRKSQKEHLLEIKITRKTLKIFLGFITCFLIGVIITNTNIPGSYWRALDPWLNTPISNNIIDYGLTPFQDKGFGHISLSGFWYFTAAINVFTDINLYTITRFGGLLMTGFVCGIFYVIFRKIEDIGAAIIGAATLVIQPQFLYRFSMTLRENFSYILLLGALLLLVRRKKDERKIAFSLSLGILLGGIITSHSLTSLVAFGIILMQLIIQREETRSIIIELLIAVSFSLILSLMFIKYIPKEVRYVIISIYSISLIIIAFKTNKKLNNFYIKLSKIKSKIIPYLGLILIIGSIIAIFYQQFNQTIYNEPLYFRFFSLFSVILSCLGLLTIIWKKPQKTFTAFTLLITSITILSFIDRRYPYGRLFIYMSLLMAYSAMLGVKFLRQITKQIEISKGKIRIYNYKRLKNKLNKFEKRDIIIFLILGSIILSNFYLKINNSQIGSPEFTDLDVKSTISFVEKLTPKDVVLPQSFTLALLFYSGFDIDQTPKGDVYAELFRADNSQEIRQIISSNYDNETKIYIYTIPRLIETKPLFYKSIPINILEDVGIKYNVGSVEYYLIKPE